VIDGTVYIAFVFYVMSLLSFSYSAIQEIFSIRFWNAIESLHLIAFGIYYFY
jgi:hypothetical protein